MQRRQVRNGDDASAKPNEGQKDRRRNDNFGFVHHGYSLPSDGYWIQTCTLAQTPPSGSCPVYEMIVMADNQNRPWYSFRWSILLWIALPFAIISAADIFAAWLAN